MDTKVPISKITKPNRQIIYFEPRHIVTPNKISSAYIVTDRCFRHNTGQEIYASVNTFLSKDEKRLINEREQRIGQFEHGCKVLADVTEAVKMISSGYVENKGILLKNAEHPLNLGLVLRPWQEIIYPCPDRIFYEKELSISAYDERIETPWFFSGISETITFFIHNLGEDDITVYTEISPDTLQRSKGSQSISMHPNEVITVVPDKFSKFIRLFATSDKKRVLCKLWFQSQNFTNNLLRR